MPTDMQLHLLRAAFLKDDKAVASWKQWRRNFDINNIDPASYNLIPKLYRNLVDLGVNDSYLQRYKGIYRAKWTKNQFEFFHLSQLIKLLYQSNIKEVLLLKGAAMTVFQYQDYGIRPFGDVDILVRQQDIFKTIKLINKLGWKPMVVSLDSISESFISTHHGVGFINKNRRPQLLDLHWQLLPELCGQNIEHLLFSNVSTMEVHDVQMYSLDSALLLFHTCVHGVKISPVPLIRWVVDALAIINNNKSNLEWDRLIEIAAITKLSLPIYSALDYLNKNFDAEIPESVMDSLQNIPVTVRERAEYYLKTAKRSNYIIAIGGSIWFQHSRLHSDKHFIHRAALFPKYLKEYWGLSSLFLVPFYIINKLTRKIYNSILQE